ncbi:MAG TPA: glycosyltransferase family 39 protein [Candidatus Limnocylindria bacterium]|nr:glycosyltransferase family 39 protein [Candidatus Limnocylindria bacterium]
MLGGSAPERQRFTTFRWLRFERRPLNRRDLDHALIAVAMIAAAAAFASQINAEGLWQDEGATAYYIQLSPVEWARQVAFAEPHNAVYYFLIRIWTIVFGLSEVALRSFSVLAAVATIPFIYLIGRRLGGTLPAAAATLLFVLNPFVLNYAVEARPYSLAMLLTTAATWLLLRAATADDGQRGRWVLYGVVMTLAVWSHFYAVFVVPAHLAWVLTCPRMIRRQGLIAVGAVLVASVPMGVAIILWSTERDWIASPTWTSAWDRLRPLVGVRRRELISIALGSAYLGALTLLLVTLLRRRLADADKNSFALWHRLSAGRALVLLWVIVPVILGLFVSLVVQPIFISRSLLVMLPALLLAFAAALPLLRNFWLSVAAILVVAAMTFSQATLNLHSSKADFRGVFTAMSGEAADGDRILIYPVRLIWMTGLYYLDRVPGLEGVELLNARQVERNEARRLIASAGGERIWLVIYDGSIDNHPLGLGSVLRALRIRGYEIERTLEVRRIQAVLYVAPPGTDENWHEPVVDAAGAQ